MHHLTTKTTFRAIYLIFGRFLFRIILVITGLFADWGWDHEVLQILIYLQILPRPKGIARKQTFFVPGAPSS
jgi:hypothetical protein